MEKRGGGGLKEGIVVVIPGGRWRAIVAEALGRRWHASGWGRAGGVGCDSLQPPS